MMCLGYITLVRFDYVLINAVGYYVAELSLFCLGYIRWSGLVSSSFKAGVRRASTRTFPPRLWTRCRIASGSCSPPSTADAEAETPTSTRCSGGYMSTDSEDGDDFDVVRNLRHYRRGQSSSSECSCESCISHSDESFFGNEEGPPMGETTAPRRAFVCLENTRERWGFLVLGLLLMSFVLSIAGLVVTKMLPSSEISGHMLYWTVPLVVVCGLCIIVWRAARYFLQRGGYSKGSHIMERRNLIRDAQAKELVYTVRGAIYAPACHSSPGYRSPPAYEVVAYENEFDPNTYIDSDLEHDGQYRNSHTPGQEADNPHEEERCSIYSRRAWFRDVPLVWWELLPSNHKDL